MSFAFARTRRRRKVVFSYSPGVPLGALGATFSRGSTATYVDSNGIVQTASSGTARDGHYINGVRSLLLEGQRTNIAIQSEDFTNGSWTSPTTGVTVTANQTTAPDGNVTADKLDFAVTTSYAYQSLTIGSSLLGTSYTWSCWVWSPSKAKIALRIAANTTAGDEAVNLVSLTAGANRVSVTRTFTSTDTAFSVGFENRVASGGDGLAGFIYAWGGQVEAASFVSSYVKTTTVAVTRSADSLYFPWLYAPQSQTLFTKFVDLGSTRVGNGGVAAICSAAAADPAFIVFAGGASALEGYSNTKATTTVAAGNIGDTLEARLTLGTDGAPGFGLSINAAAEVLATPGAALTLPGAWSGQRLYLNAQGSSFTGFAAFQSLKMALGVKSLADMRAA